MGLSRLGVRILMASVLMASSPAWATRDAMLPWSSFLVESAGLDDSGPVSVSGKQDSAGITSFRVQAFERTYELRSKQLEKLKGVHANGIELLLSGGRTTLTGRMLTIRLSRGFAGDVVVGKAITICDSGEISIGDMPSSEQPGTSFTSVRGHHLHFSER